MEVGTLLTGNFQNKKATQYLKRAYETFKADYADDHQQVINSTFWYAKNLYDLREFEDAEPLLIDVFEAHEKNQAESKQLAQTTATLLIRIYEKQKERDSANKYVRAIAKANVATSDLFP